LKLEARLEGSSLLLCESTEHGTATAQLCLGACYEWGTGTIEEEQTETETETETVAVYKKAAERD
jgi:hypothetical protein